VIAFQLQSIKLPIKTFSIHFSLKLHGIHVKYEYFCLVVDEVRIIALLSFFFFISGDLCKANLILIFSNVLLSASLSRNLSLFVV